MGTIRRARVAAAVATCVALATGCRAGPAGARRGADATAEAAVYAAVLDGLFRDGASAYVVDPARDRFDWDVAEVVRRMPDVPIEVVRAARLSSAGTMPRDLETDLPLHWFPETDGTRASPDAKGPGGLDWAELERRFPGAAGYVGFSGVGFSRDRASALLHVYRTRGPLSGEGRLVWLSRASGAWRVVRAETTVSA